MRIIDAHVFFLDKILLYFFWHMVMNTDTLGTLNKTMPTLSQGVLLCFVNVSSKFDTRVGMFNISLLAPDPVSLQHSVLKVSSLFPFLFGLLLLVEFLVSIVRFFMVKMFFQMHSYVIVSFPTYYFYTSFFICCGLWDHLEKSYEIRNQNKQCLGFKSKVGLILFFVFIKCHKETSNPFIQHLPSFVVMGGY